ncbi:neurofilament medium polypeptide-like [Quercus lobata]|uniref:neurofilament medium polypeptide-like n=1 Tax=Quercus lobata TaxID=97700 RepID=UPI0012471E1A|nr:neurofilament medium polypeptide-like [Quercus lobata]
MGEKEDRRFTKPNLKLVNKASLDRGFIVPEGIPIPWDTSRTELLFVAAVSTGASSSQPILREEEVEEQEEEEEEEEEVVELSDSSEDFGVFDQPIRSEEDLDEMGIQRKPQRSLMELIENQPGGKNAPGKSTQSQIPSLPTKSPPPAPRPPSHQPQQPVRVDAVELKRRREQKGKDVVDVGKSRPNREEDAQRVAKQQKTSHLPQQGQESQLDDEKKKQATAVQTLTQSEQDLVDARKKLLAEEQARKSADSALEGYQSRPRKPKKHSAWEQVAVLKKHLEET